MATLSFMLTVEVCLMAALLGAGPGLCGSEKGSAWLILSITWLGTK